MHTDNKFGFVGTHSNYMKILEDQGQKGWTCPKCGTVYSPYINICMACSHPPTQPNPSNPWIKPEHTPVEYPWSIDVWDNTDSQQPDFHGGRDESGWWTHPPTPIVKF